MSSHVGSPRSALGGPGTQRAITSLLASQYTERDIRTPGGTTRAAPQSRYSMRRDGSGTRAEWVQEAFATPNWAVSVQGQRIRPQQSGSARRQRPQRGPTPSTPGAPGDGAAEPGTWRAEEWGPSASPPRTPPGGAPGFIGHGGGGQAAAAAEMENVAVERVSTSPAGRPATGGGRAPLQAAVWPPPQPQAPGAADVAQTWKATAKPVQPSPRGGMSASPRGLRGPAAPKHAHRVETILHGKQTSVPRGLHKSGVLTPRGKAPTEFDPVAGGPNGAIRALGVESAAARLAATGSSSAQWVLAVQPQQSLYSTWSSLPAPEHSLEETWKQDPDVAATLQKRIKGSPMGQTVHIFPYEHRAEVEYGERMRSPRAHRYPEPPPVRGNVDSARIKSGARKMQRGGAHEVSRAAQRDGHSTHPLINPSPLPLMDRLGAQMLAPTHRDDLTTWQGLNLY